MTNLNDEKIRQELVRRYLNAETTLEEERMLADFLCDTDIVLSAEEEDILLMLQTSDFIGRPEISEEKAKEFDRLMQRRDEKSKTIALRWIVFAAAAIICAFLFMPVRLTDNAEEQPGLTMVTPDGSDITSAEKTGSISTPELLEAIKILSDIGTDDMTITASSSNDGFIIKASTSNEPPSSYMLKRCSDGTSIELKSLFINF